MKKDFYGIRRKSLENLFFGTGSALRANCRLDETQSKNAPLLPFTENSIPYCLSFVKQNHTILHRNIFSDS